ncbi:hypothetical protein [Streptomyces sp. NPDC058252]|uniref:hypothetical protein n=1 Tax=Streptomyces sp. NPDC058252 TaxID=3346405 RepID=UPI0036E43A23
MAADRVAGDASMQTVVVRRTGRTGRRTRRVPWGRVTCALLALFALSTVFATATPAQAAGSASPSTQAAYLATRLRTNPVYVTDQLPREIPRSQAPAFATLAKRTGVPTYVLVLPEQDLGGKGLLGAVHDRLGRDGLYVLLDTSGVTDAVAYGVRAPADDAATASLYELPYDAGPLRSFERFVDVVAQGSGKAAERAAAAREKYGESDAEPDRMYIDRTDRDNQSFLTGALLTGVPLLILLSISYVRRWRHILLKVTGRAKPDSRRTPEWLASVLALVTLAVIVVTTALTFDQTTSSAAVPPTAADVSSRVDRVSAGLEQDPVYVDPEGPQVLDSRQLSHLHERIRKFARSDGGGPVYVLLVPQLSGDESGGDPEAFADAVHAELSKAGKAGNGRKDDGLYVVADTLRGDIDVLNFGLRLDSGRLYAGLPESIVFGDDEAREAEDHLLGERLDDFMTFLDKSPRTTEPNTTSDQDTKAEPIEGNALPQLFSGDFWPGLLVGGLGALLVLGLVAGVLAIVGSVLRRRHPLPTASESSHLQAPRGPSLSYLRTTADDELGALSEDFVEADVENAGLAHRARAWDCFDAAMLLIDGDRCRLTEPDDAGDPDEAENAAGGGVDPATLVTIIVLARAGRAALRGEAYEMCCGLNPLHGPAVVRHPVRVSAEDRRRRRLPVCDACRDSAIREPGAVHTLLMALPAPPDPDGGSRDRVPYDVLESPLSAVSDGIPRLIDAVRELAGAE